MKPMVKKIFNNILRKLRRYPNEFLPLTEVISENESRVMSKMLSIISAKHKYNATIAN